VIVRFNTFVHCISSARGHRINVHMRVPEMQLADNGKTPGTVDFYERIKQRLIRHANSMEVADAHRKDFELRALTGVTDQSMRIALAFADLEPTVSAATARLYRSAATYAVEKYPTILAYDALQILHPEASPSESDRLERLAEQRSANLSALRGPQQKAKWLPADDWRTLFNALLRGKGEWAYPTFCWLMASLATGLRPCEWRDATVVAGKLRVNSAKTTHGRSHGATRTIDLTNSPMELRQVERFIGLVQATGKDRFRDMYNGVRNHLRKVARREFPGREKFVTLYTARHVFAARAKSTFGREWVAALMGHGALETAARHYAPSRHARGSSPLKVEPAMADVDAVRRAISARALVRDVIETRR